MVSADWAWATAAAASNSTTTARHVSRTRCSAQRSEAMRRARDTCGGTRRLQPLQRAVGLDVHVVVGAGTAHHAGLLVTGLAARNFDLGRRYVLGDVAAVKPKDVGLE